MKLDMSWLGYHHIRTEKRVEQIVSKTPQTFWSNTLPFAEKNNKLPPPCKGIGIGTKKKMTLY